MSDISAVTMIFYREGFCFSIYIGMVNCSMATFASIFIELKFFVVLLEQFEEFVNGVRFRHVRRLTFDSQRTLEDWRLFLRLYHVRKFYSIYSVLYRH